MSEDWDEGYTLKSTDDFHTYGERPAEDDDAYWARINRKHHPKGTNK
jgi:hypothetical protein